MAKFVMLSVLICVVAGCNSNSDYLSEQRREAIKCAENWKAQGYDFDPNSMACWQMYQRAQAIRTAEFWGEKGYLFDPNSMTRIEMGQKVKDIDRARYWKKRGYDFDANLMTAREIDQKAKELDKTKYWKKLGYYYDPNSQTVFLTSRKRTKLKSLAGLHGQAKVPTNRPNLPVSSADSGRIYINTGGGHWIRKNFDSGRFIQLEDNSLWEVSPIHRIDSMLWLPISEITVIESWNSYYPHLLINTDDGEKVEAKLISR